MGRWIGVDYGTKRIGIAVSDFGGRIASPERVIQAVGRPQQDADLVLAAAAELEAEAAVVGLPLNMADGSDSNQTRIVRSFANQLEVRGSITVELWDERLSSYQADQHMSQAGVPRSRRKELRDALAAQVILQAFLDSRRQSELDDDAPA